MRTCIACADKFEEDGAAIIASTMADVEHAVKVITCCVWGSTLERQGQDIARNIERVWADWRRRTAGGTAGAPRDSTSTLVHPCGLS